MGHARRQVASLEISEALVSTKPSSWPSVSRRHGDGVLGLLSRNGSRLALRRLLDGAAPQGRIETFRGTVRPACMMFADRCRNG